MFRSSFGFVVLATIFAASLYGNRTSFADEPTLSKHLEPLRPYLGKTFKGEFANSTPSKPVIDVQKWERALNGQAIRILHSVNHGAYGGESIIFWDAEKQTLAYHYFTTAGFVTIGEMKQDEKKWVSLEKVKGNKNGVTEVKSISEILSDGRLKTSTDYLKDGKWTPGHEIIYVEDSTAEVRFK